MKFFPAIPIFTFLCFSLSAQQTINVSVKATLPTIINESSGLETSKANSLWTHNDSGGQPDLYNIDTNGVLLKTLHVSNATNVDWEEVAYDTAGNFFACDFGNNNNDRQDLVIYKIVNPDLISGNSVAAQLIHFTYPDQHGFPPPQSQRNFDMEAMIVMKDSLYLFSKNRTNPYSGYSKEYRLPTVPGTYVATLVDSFYTGSGQLDDYSFTAADITNSHDSLVIISHFRLWLFTNFTGTNFFSGNVQEFIFSSATKKEGVCFKSANELYLTDEYNGNGTGKLYYLKFPIVINGTDNTNGNLSDAKIYPNPFSNEINISATNFPSGQIHYELRDACGRICAIAKSGRQRA